VNGKCHGLSARMNHGEGMKPFDVLRLVGDISFTDEVFSFFFEDKFLDGLADVSGIKLRRIYREAC
jgi:hypothetical protein